jgi:iron complex outermembrane receptor protein
MNRPATYADICPRYRHPTSGHLSAYLLKLLPLLACTVPFHVQAVELEEVVVIGQGIGNMRLDTNNNAGSRLGLSALETPASVDLISREELATKGDHDTLSAITRSAGISADANPGNGGTAVSVRGFTGPNSIVTTYDGTRLYVTAGTVTFPADTWTIDHVEVLRGAGSVVNGLGAIGATVNYVPKAPKPGTTSFESLLAVGSFDMLRVALGGGADLADQLAFRLDASHQQSDSNVDRNVKRRDVAAGSLLLTPNDVFKMKFSVDYADLKEESPYFGTPLINGAASDALREQNYNFGDGFLEYQDIWARVHSEWRMTEAVTLRNDTYLLEAERQWQNLENYSYSTGTGLIDRDGESYYGIIHDQQQLGTRSDVLFDSTIGGLQSKLTIGFDVNSIDLNYSNNWAQGVFYAGNSVPVFGWTPDTLATANISTVLAFTTDTKQIGWFFDEVLELNSQWSVLLGARYDSIDFSRTNLALGGSPQVSFESKYSEWSWRSGVVFQPMDNLSVYAQYSRATDPITSPVTMSFGNRNFDPTRGRQLEAGLKHQLMGGKAEYTLALFDIKKTGLVTRIPGTTIDEQVGAQSSMGVEATLRINPTRKLSLDANVAWVDAEFDEFFSGGVSLAGKAPRNVPDFTANTWVNWTPLAALNLGAGVRHVASRFGDNTNTGELPAYTVLDSNASWDLNRRTKLTLQVRNLNNEREYVLSEYATNQWLFAEPRSVELSIKYAL